jgi:hypothetical protein
MSLSPIAFHTDSRKHGIPRYSSAGEKSPEARQQESRKIEKYRELDQSVHDKVRPRVCSLVHC